MVRRNSNSSTLNGKLSQFARSKAPPTPVKTAKFRGALTPNASVIATPNDSKRSPLNTAVARVCQPTRRRKTEEDFSASGDDPSGGIIPAGKYQLSLCFRTVRNFPFDIRLPELSPQTESVGYGRQETNAESILSSTVAWPANFESFTVIVLMYSS